MEILENSNTRLSTDNPRGGVNVYFDLSTDIPLQQSPAWLVGGRRLQFFRLASGQLLSLPAGDNYVKVITGHLEKIDRTCLAPPFTVRSTQVSGNELQAGEAGAFFAVMTLMDDAPQKIHDMSTLKFQGDHSEHLTWKTFEARFSKFMDFFNGKDCYMADGLHLLDENEQEIVYLNFWTCGKGVDLSTHNHGNPPSPMAPGVYRSPLGTGCRHRVRGDV